MPDIDRTDYLLCIGANPWISNGSFLTAPDVRRRLRAIRARGGRIVVVDPRRSETAHEADEWIAIRPGCDAALLLAMTQALIADSRVDEARLDAVAEGWARVRERLAGMTPERVAAFTGVSAATIRRLAHEFADAPSGSAYSRVGVCNSRFGTLATWATDVLNLAAGRLGAVGGAMFATPAIDLAALAHFVGDGHARWRSRVRGLPETLGDLPAATLADEIETPGAGQVRALITYAGNPVLSVPNGRRLERALGGLEFMVAIDLYVNETTRHADVILPPAWTLAEDHFDLFMANQGVRNVARWCPPVFGRGAHERADWEILLEIAERLGGGATGLPVIDRAIRHARRVGLRWTPTATANLLTRLGPHGDKFLPWSSGLNLSRLAAAPHGIDLGPLEPGVARRVLLVHPADAERCGVRDGQVAQLESRIHRGAVLVQVDEDMAPGVVSLPHGWGHAQSAPWQRVAGARPGVSANDWTDDGDVEGVVGQSILNGVPVRLVPVP